MLTIILCLLPIALVCLRFPREPGEIVFLRYLCAFVVAWCAFGAVCMAQHDQAMAAIEASGDLEAADRDTGAGAMVILVGWLPALLYLGFLSVVWYGLLARLVHRPNHALQRTEAGGDASSDLHA